MSRRPRIAYLGDDFSGSTDVMEVLARFGLDVVLFTSLPDDERLARVDADAIGVAGGTRSLPAARMANVVLPALERFREMGASLIHYKICSTFDSSPDVGSIGRVIDLGAEILGARVVPVLVGAPVLGRYCVFGNLFARSGLDSPPFRLDRHPTMARHPVTPMSESDLRVHLAAQTSREIGLVDVLALSEGGESARRAYRDLLESGVGVVLFDTLTDAHLEVAGEVIHAELSADGASFVVGSSGVEMALGEAWIRAGLSPGRRDFASPGQAEPLLVLSGSCSPVTRRQIEHAESRGFATEAVDTPAIAAGSEEPEIDRVTTAAAGALRSSRGVIVHTALGPDDPRIESTRARLRERIPGDDAALKERGGSMLGGALGIIGRRVLASHPVRRVVVTGGDTGSSVARELGIETLQMLAPMAPGSPLCRARGPGLPESGLEIVFKGGQVGRVDFIEKVLEGSHQYGGTQT